MNSANEYWKYQTFMYDREAGFWFGAEGVFPGALFDQTSSYPHSNRVLRGHSSLWIHFHNTAGTRWNYRGLSAADLALLENPTIEGVYASETGTGAIYYADQLYKQPIYLGNLGDGYGFKANESPKSNVHPKPSIPFSTRAVPTR